MENTFEIEEQLNHEKWMRLALAEAKISESKGEVPIGAIIVYQGKVIAKAHNLRELSAKATAHAELLVINQANDVLNQWRLEGATLYVTLEPCAMCAGAIILSRVSTVVFGARDPKAGCAGSLMNLLDDKRLNHQPKVIEGVLAEESGAILTTFFRALRQKKKQAKLQNQSENDDEN